MEKFFLKKLTVRIGKKYIYTRYGRVLIFKQEITMKKTALLLGLLSVIGISVAVAEPVPSVNMVGYASKAVFVNATNRFFFMGAAFSKIGNTNDLVTVTDLLGTNAITPGTIVYLWSGSNYVSEIYGAGKWFPGTNPVSRSDGFWFKAAGTGTATLSGEVPNSSMVVTTITAIAPGYNMLAFPYPVQRALRSMAFTNCAADGDIVYKWNPTTAGWISSIYANALPNKWTVNHTFEVGEGFWYKRGASAGSTNWVEVKPY